MSKGQKFVVKSPNDLYLIAFNEASPSDSLFGNIQSAIEFDTLEEAERMASLIGGGTVGTTK